MKHTIASSTIVTVPIAFSFKCPYCGKENIKTTNLKKEVLNTAWNNSRYEAINGLQKSIDSLVQGTDLGGIKDAGLYCVCSNCAKTPPWANNKSSPLTYIMVSLFLIFAVVMICVLLPGNTFLGDLLPSESLQDNIAIIVTVAVVLLVILIVVCSIAGSNKKPKSSPLESMPKVLAVGEEAKSYASVHKSIY